VALFEDKYFLLAMRNTLLFVLSSVVVQLGIAFALSLFVFQNPKGSLFFRTIYFAPAVISSVAVALMFSMIYAPKYGLLDAVLSLVGLSSLQHPWLSDPNIAIYFAIAPKLWQFVGLYVMIFYTGLISIPGEIFESVQMDGAGPLTRLFNITIPLMRDVIAMSVILVSINTWKSFEQIWVLTGGGPAHSTEIVGTYMVNEIFNTFQYGYGSAISVVILVFGVSLAAGLQLGLNFSRRY